MVKSLHDSPATRPRTGKFLSLRRSTHDRSAAAASPALPARPPVAAVRGSTRKRTLVVREAQTQVIEDTSSDDGDEKKIVVSGWLVRLHNMLTLQGKEHIIEYTSGKLFIRDPDALASEVRGGEG